MTDSPAHPRIVYFSHNRSDTAFIRRVHCFVEAGVAITTFSFRRDGEAAVPGPPWENVDLGHADHRKFVRRAVLYANALRTVFVNRRQLMDADVIYARNLDVFLFALVSTWLSCGLRGHKPTFVYECLDVHETLLGSGLKARLLRAVERRVLSISRLLVVSSPGFIEHYFAPIQHYDGPVHWVENKLLFNGDEPARRLDAPKVRSGSQPLTIGWVGIIRCQSTLDLLVALAQAEREKVEVRITGMVSYFLLPDFDRIIAAEPNIHFTGPYDWPDGLANAYHGIDIVWSQELAWSGGNSDWLIPNRVYEASYFGVPSLCVGDTQTARIVRERNLGFVLNEPTPDALIQFVRQVDGENLTRLQRDLLQRPPAQFVLQAADTTALLEAIDRARHATNIE